ncbi:MAG: rod shape-determining protein MreC [Candidatus Lloydbacteria bacterium]|nr:rod shape-determining protein MreC [Candidatus Lloydbacteria bacterium]
MTMYYRQHNNNEPLPIKKLALVLVFIVLAVFSGKTFSNNVSSFFTPIEHPLLRFGASVHIAINNLFPFFKTNKALIEENKTLKSELGEVNGRLLTYNLLVEENKTLKESFNRTAAESPILANILAGPSRSPYDTFILDAGLREDVAVGDMISVFETVALGTITEVSSQTAKATLFSAPGEKTAVRLAGGHTPVDIVGQGGGMFLFTLPRDIPVMRGDMLALPGIHQKIVGIVTNIDTPSNNPFQTVTAVVPINIFELERVFISRAGAPFLSDETKTKKATGN